MRPINAGFSRMAALAASALVLLSFVGSAHIDVKPEAANPATAALVQMVRDELSNSSPQVSALNARVAIGAEAFRQALAHDDGRPLVAAYITSTEFEAVLGERRRAPHVTAVFSNPDPLDQIALAHTLLGRSALGVFDSPAARSLVTRVTGQGARAIPVSPNQGIDSLLRAANPFDVIIVLPDSTVLNRSNINHVVRTLYQRRKVLIGYSDTLTQVGSLASVYVSPEAIARSVENALEQYAATGALPNPIFVRDIEVSINDRLARSLNIALPERAEILKAVRSRKTEQEATP